MIVNAFIFWVLFTLALQLLLKEFEVHVLVRCDQDLVQVGLANRTLFIFHNKSKPQATSMAHILMSTDTQCNEFKLVKAQNTVILIAI